MKKTAVVVMMLLVACSTTQKMPANPPNSVVVDGKIFTTVFQQRAAEYRALCYQAYNIAFLRLDQALTRSTVKPKAIVTDIDETVLDNSMYAARQALMGKDYDPESWEAFTSLGIADTVPGAFNFLRYAASQGVEIFYITNRDPHERAGTLQNLKRFGFPFADETHLITRQGSSGKESRRQSVAATHEIIMLIGDNLSDFSFIFDKKSVEDRFAATNGVAEEFGRTFILLPNPVYGDWEQALYHYNYNLSPARKDSLLRSWLKSF